MRSFFMYLEQYQSNKQLDERKVRNLPPKKIPVKLAQESVRKFFAGDNVRYEVINTFNGFDYQATVVDSGICSLPEFEREVSEALKTLNLKAQTCVMRENYCKKSDSVLVKIHVN